MKKFLIFLVAIVVVVSFGLTIFYFVRNDEVINFTTKEIYCNVGDHIKQEDLGLSVKRRNKKTKYNYNAGGEDVTSLVKYNAEYGQYDILTEVGGDVTITITTSNKRASKFEILLHIGDGKSAETPYYISNENQLAEIGGDYASNAYYVLMNDIDLTSTYQPVELFDGNFNGNSHVISNLQVTEGKNSAGLFGRVENATVTDVKLQNFAIDGNFNYAGALAGIVSNSKIARVAILNADVASTAAVAEVGGLAGEISANSDISSCYVDGTTLTSNNLVGGLVGKLDRSLLRATYAVAELKTGAEATDAVVGGLVGEFAIGSESGSIQQSYAYPTSTYAQLGTLIGKVSKANSFTGEVKNEKVYLVGNYAVGDEGNEINSNSTGLFETLYTKDEDYKIVSISKSVVEEKKFEKDQFVFFQSMSGKTLWKDTNAWSVTTINLPTLRMAKEFNGLTADFINSTVNGVVGGDNPDTDTARSALESKLNNPTESFALKEGYTYDMTGVTIEDPKDVENISIIGNGATIDNLTVNGCLFNKVDNCSIEKVTFTNLKIVGEAKGLFGEVTSTNYYTKSLISNVTVSYKSTENDITTTANTFGGLAAVVKNGTVITGAKVANLTVNVENVQYVAGVVGNLESGSLDKSSVENISLSGARYLAGAVAANSGAISNFTALGENEITTKSGTQQAAGLVATNKNGGAIENSTSNIAITIDGLQHDSWVGGLVAQNLKGAKLTDSGLTGKGIVIQSIGGDYENIGGIAASNNGEISNVYCTAENVGTYNTNGSIDGKKVRVGGVVFENSGTISQAVVTSNLAGNEVAGVVHTNSGRIDQVLVGYNTKTGKRNTIVGDKFVAGVAYELTDTASITNVQTRSTIEGKTNETVSSLVLLIFPNGTTFENAAIDNEAIGFGRLYTETWTDKDGAANSYNLYGTPGAAGSFKSVVINNTHIANGLNVKSSFFSWTAGFFFWNTTYDVDGNTNFFRYVNDEDFAKFSTFNGNYELVANSDNSTGWANFFEGGADRFNRTWTFDGNIWSSGDGIALSFLDGQYAE